MRTLMTTLPWAVPLRRGPRLNVFEPATPTASAAQGIAALAAAPADSGTIAGALVVVAAASGALYIMQAGSKGLFARQFFRPGGAQPGRPASAGSAAAAAPSPGGAAASSSAGLLTALGSALSSAYAEAFDPLYRVSRRQPSAKAAIQAALVPVSGAAMQGGGSGSWQLLVLTGEALDCWSLSLGKRAAESWVGVGRAVVQAPRRQTVSNAATGGQLARLSRPPPPPPTTTTTHTHLVPLPTPPPTTRPPAPRGRCRPGASTCRQCCQNS